MDIKTVDTLNINLFKSLESYKKNEKNLKNGDLSFVEFDIEKVLKDIDNKADKTVLQSYPTKEQVSKDYMPNKFSDNGKNFTWEFRTVNGAPQIVVREVE